MKKKAYGEADRLSEAKKAYSGADRLSEAKKEKNQKKKYKMLLLIGGTYRTSL